LTRRNKQTRKGWF